MTANPDTLHLQPELLVKRSFAVYALWQTGIFDTLDIARLLSMDEAEAQRVFHSFRNRNRRRAP